MICAASMSTLLLLLLLGGESRPLLASRGDDLATFDVVADVARVAHDSPRALAESYAAFDAAVANDVEPRFARVSADAHLRVLERYYVPELVARQRKEYDGVLPRSVAHAVLEESALEGGGVLVLLERTSRAGDKTHATRVRLKLRREGKWWWVDAVESGPAEGPFAPRDIGLPPLVTAPAVPPEEPVVRGTPTGTLKSLRRDMARLLALRARGQGALYRHYLDIVRAFYGDAVAERARREQPRAAPAPKVEYEMSPPATEGDGVVVVETAALETVPESPSKRSAVGVAAFRLRRDVLGDWFVLEELVRKEPSAPFTPSSGPAGLFFLR